MINNISLDTLKIFYEVAKCGNITKASKKIFISQPAITQSLNKLEQTLNTTLFIRHSKGVTLTPVGEKIYNNVASAMIKINDINEILQEDKNILSGSLVIGCGTILAKEVLFEYINNFIKTNPNIDVKIIDATYEQKIKDIQIGEMDIALVQENTTNIPNIKSIPFFETKYILVASPSFKHKHLSTDNLNKQTFITQVSDTSSRKIFDLILSKNNITPHKIYELSGFNLVKEFCTNNLGIAFLPEFLVKKELIDNKLIQVNTDFDLPKNRYVFLTHLDSKKHTVTAFLATIFNTTK